jgi:WD40 repeat protein
LRPTLRARRRGDRGHAYELYRAAFSPDGKYIVTASHDKTARLWDAETGKPIGEPLTGHADAVLSAAFSPDGKRIVTASWDKTARLWDTETGKPIGEPLTGHAGPVWSAAAAASSPHLGIRRHGCGKFLRTPRN